jgi:glycosyltransferase involved in cell wall biosynthesis
MRHADKIAIMSQAGERFLRKYFPTLKQRTFELPPWSRDGFPSSSTRPANAQFTLTLGGQLVAGRNLETLVRAMALLPEASRAQLVIAGSGPLGDGLRALTAELGLANVEFAGQLDREKYFELLQRSAVGLTTISGNVSIPAYPSKIAGYAGMGLPILMAVEPFADYGEQVERAGAGIAVPAGDPELLASAITQLEEEFVTGVLADRGRAARKLYETTLSSDSAARTILRQMDLT